MAELPADSSAMLNEDRERLRLLRLLVTEDAPKKPSPPDPEVKAMLEDMNRRYRVNRERLNANDDDDGLDVA